MNVSYLSTNLIPDGTTNLTPFDSTVTANVGFFTNSRVNALETCQEIASSVGAYLVTDISGKFKLVQLQADIASTPAYYVTAQDMEERSLQISEKLAIEGSVKLAYCKNWTVQTDGLAAGLDIQSDTLFRKDWFYTISKDDSILAKYKQNTEFPQKDTFLIVETEAAAEAARLLTIKKSPRFIYTATYFSHMLLVELGDTINIKYPRFGLDNGKTGMVVSINRDWLKGRITIGVFI